MGSCYHIMYKYRHTSFRTLHWLLSIVLMFMPLASCLVDVGRQEARSMNIRTMNFSLPHTNISVKGTMFVLVGVRLICPNSENFLWIDQIDHN